MDRFQKYQGNAALKRLPLIGLAAIFGAALLACTPGAENEVTAPKIVAGAAHACAYDKDREQVVCWGDNSYGQLGNEEFSAAGVSAPTRVKAVSGRKIKSLSAGFAHTCALVAGSDEADTSNTVACWGYNHYGQIGDSSNKDRNVPYFVLGPDGKVLKGAANITAGAYHTCASMAYGSTYQGKTLCWGRNNLGQIGNGSLVNVNVPTEIKGLEYSGGVAAGTAHTCALTAKSQDDANDKKYQVFCWGDASRGQMLGAKIEGGLSYATKPVEIELKADGNKVEGIRAIYSEHVVQSDVTTATNKPAEGELAAAPETPAYGQTCAITQDQVICWGGANQNGQWGTMANDVTQYAVKANEIGGASSLVAYGAGNAQSCMLVGNGSDSSANEVACWGYSSSLGFGMPEDATDTVLAENRKPVTLQGQRPTGLAVGREFVCYAAKGEQPQIWCWGIGKKGQIGNGRVDSYRVPQCVKGYCPDTDKDANLVEGQPFDEAPGPAPSALQVSAGPNGTCAVMVGGGIKCWGVAAFSDSQDPIKHELPADVDDLGGVALNVQVSEYQVCARVLGGAVKCWGNPAAFYSYSANIGEYSRPQVAAGFAANVKDFKLGYLTLCGRLETQSVTCLYNSTQYTFELNGTNPSLTMMNVGGGETPCIVDAGAVKCRFLGSNENTTLFGYESDVVAFAASQFIGVHCGVMTGGGVKCSFGDGASEIQLPAIQSIEVGGQYACVLTKSGGVKCWGSNSYGQLGNGTNADSSSPVDVQGLQSGVIQLSVGDYHACAVLFGGIVKCWGANRSGELGDGTTENSNVPVIANLSGETGPRGEVVANPSSFPEGQDQVKVTITIPTFSGDIGYDFDCDGDKTFEIKGTLAGHECFYHSLQSGSHDVGYKIIMKGLFGNVEVDGTKSFAVQNLPPVITAVDTDPAVLQAGSAAAENFTIRSVAATDPGRDALVYGYDCNRDGVILGAVEVNKGATNVVCDLSGLAPGTYSLSVVVTDADHETQGNGQTTKPITITIVPALDTAIGTKPAAYAGTTATFTFSSAETDTIETKLDGAAYAVTTAGTRSYSALTDGTHTFFARAVSGGNADASPASYTWIVDSVAPVTVSDTTFTQPVGTDSVNIAFHATDVNLTGITFQCRLDTGSFSACTPGSFGPVAEGSHSLTVKAYDAAGNATTSPATVAWSYWAPPETTLDGSGPSGTVSQTTGTFTFSSGTATSFECKLDNGAWEACTSPYTTPTLGNGSHTVSIRAIRNGVPDATVATRTWTVDTGTPVQQPVTGSTLSAGSVHACAVKAGKLYCWGTNMAGQLGDVTGPHSSPSQMGSATDWASVSAGPNHTCALRAAGALYCWGANSSGQLGDPNTSTFTGSPSPVAVASGQTWRKVAAIDQHTCAVRTDQSLWCWGSNGTGALGLGQAGADVTVPTQVGSNTNWIDVGGGYGFTCALNATGAMYCWGEGSMGNLGVGTLQSSNGFGAPMTAAATNVKAMTAGGQVACAVKNDGTLWCWGDNTASQGGNAVVDRTLPSQVGSATDWKSVEAGIFHTCAIKTDKTRWCWGDWTDNGLGDDGQYGGNQAAPVQIGTDTDWLEISCENGFCVAMRDNTGANDIFSWGKNGFNQCGTDGIMTPVVSPILLLTPFP